MARSFKDAIREQRFNRDALQDVDETAPGFIPDPSTFSESTPGGARRAQTFSQVIAENSGNLGYVTGNPYKPLRPDLSSSPYKPDWRGHYEAGQRVQVSRSALQLATPWGRVEALRRKFTPETMR